MKRKPAPEVEIPITPMLDMAFQLLTFFILTYRPAPAEGQFAMNLLPPQEVARIDAPPPDPNAAASDTPAPLRTVTTVLRAGADGGLGRVTLGEVDVSGLDGLRAKLGEILANPDLQYDQTLIQFEPQLRYAELMRVIDVFSGAKITKISFAELEGGEAAEPSP